METATSTSCKKIFGPPSGHVLLDKVYGGPMTVLLPIAPLPLKNSCWTSLETGSSAVGHTLRDQRILQIWILWILLLGLSSKKMYSAKPTTVDELINVVDNFQKNIARMSVTVYHLMFWSGRISVCSKMEATSSTFYKMYFLFLIIENPLFQNVLVYYSSFVLNITMNKGPLKI